MRSAQDTGHDALFALRYLSSLRHIANLTRPALHHFETTLTQLYQSPSPKVPGRDGYTLHSWRGPLRILL
jgi:hypothetical protein